jgi:hypothetical protein
LQQDEELLKQDLPIRHKLAVRMRLGEKKILRKLGSYFFERSKVLAKQLEKEMTAEGGETHDEL